MKLEDIIVTKEDGEPTYIYLQPEKRGVKGCVSKTVEIKDDIYVDLDENGEIIGIEVL